MFYKKPKALIWCDTPTVPTGFGIVAKNLLRDLHKNYEVEIIGINYNGDEKYDTDKWFIYPAAQYPDVYGYRKMEKIIPKSKPDIIFLFQDIFNISVAWEKIKRLAPQAKVVIYFPVDGTPFNYAWSKPLEKADAVITYTNFAKESILETFPELKDKKIHVLTHGIDTSVFNPLTDKEIKNIRGELGWENKFIILNLNRFQPRKMIPLTLRAALLFTKGYHKCKCGNWYWTGRDKCDLNGCSKKDVVETVKGHPDTLLYLHMVPNEQSMGPGHANSLQAHAYNAGYRDEDLSGKKQSLQINASDLYSNPVPEETLNKIYNASCVNISTTIGEGFGFCVKPDTEIFTENGPKQIKDVVEEKDKVLTESGKFEKVLKKVINKKDLLEFKIRGTVNLGVSKEHPFYGFKMNGKPLKYAKNGFKPEWIKAENLEPRDLVGFPKPKLDAKLPTNLDLKDYVEGKNIIFDDKKIWNKMGFSPKTENHSIQDIQKSEGETKKIVETARRHIKKGTVPKKESRVHKVYTYLKNMGFKCLKPNKYNRFIKIDDDFLYFVGWYVAEGSSDGGNCVDFSLHADEYPVAKKLGEIGKRIFGANFTIRKRKTTKVCSLVFCSSIMAQFFEKMCGKYAKNKYIHKIFFQAASSISSLIRGYFEGDGHLSKVENTFSCTTVSKKLAWQLRNILASQNIYSRISFINKQNAWVVLVGGADNNLFSEWIGIKNYSKSIRKNPDFSIKTEDFIFVPIKKITTGSKDSLVYDLQVENTHSFVGNGILLHNSLAESAAAGTPSIAPKNSAIPEVLGSTGHLVKNVAHFNMAMDNGHIRPIVDVRGIVSSLEEEYDKWIKNKKIPIKSKNAIERVKKVFNWEDKRQVISAIFEDVLKNNQSNFLLEDAKFSLGRKMPENKDLKNMAIKNHRKKS